MGDRDLGFLQSWQTKGQGVEGTGTKKRTARVPRISLSANAQLGTQHPCLCACVQSSLARAQSTHSWAHTSGRAAPHCPLPGHKSQRKRRGSSGSHGWRCVPRKLAHSFLLLLSALDTRLICGKAVVAGGGVQDSPPANPRAGDSRWDPDWPRDTPVPVLVLEGGSHRSAHNRPCSL